MGWEKYQSSKMEKRTRRMLQSSVNASRPFALRELYGRRMLPDPDLIKKFLVYVDEDPVTQEPRYMFSGLVAEDGTFMSLGGEVVVPGEDHEQRAAAAMGDR